VKAPINLLPSEVHEMTKTPSTDATTISRRNALKLTAAGLLAAAAPGGIIRASQCCAAAKPAKHIPICLQLYSVRGDCGKDIDAAMTQVAEMGFEGVEFAGYYKYGSDAKALKKKLDDLGLKAAATHIRTNSFIGDALKRTIDFHKTIGCKFLIVPGDGAFSNPEKSKVLAETFNKTAEALKPEGMYCGYHNHTHEFKKVGDKTYWELFAERTSDDVVLQMDVGWTVTAGQDPVALIRKYPGRTKSTHFKPATLKGDKGKTHLIGQDSVDWKGVIAACREVGGTEWITIEQERYPDGKSPMECSKLSLEGLKKLLG
jgi:sugar phosphate isomerase/epimerase